MREIFVGKMNGEINRVKGLKGRCLPWYDETIPKDESLADNPIEMMKGLSGEKLENLREAGVKTVSNYNT